MRRLLGWLIALGLLGGGGYLAYKKAQPPPPQVGVEPVVRTAIAGTVSGVASGVVEPRRRVTVQAEALARVKEVRIKRGDRVKAGDILVVLNDADVRDQIRSLAAAIPLLEARVRQARTRTGHLQGEEQRMRALASRGVVPQAQLESAVNGRSLSALEGEAANAQLLQARVNLQVAQASLRKTVVKAPFDGVVLDVRAEVGEQAQGSSGSSGLSAGTGTGGAAALLGGVGGLGGLVELCDESELHVLVDVDEMDFGKVAVGQPALLTFDALRKRTMRGKVAEIYPYVSRTADQNRTVRVKVRLPEEARGVVLVGMSVNAEIVVERRERVLVVPSQCVLTREGQKAVLKLVAGHLKQVPVRIGIATFDHTQIEAGVGEGDLLAVPSTKIRLVDGMRVEVAAQPKPPDGRVAQTARP